MWLFSDTLIAPKVDEPIVFKISPNLEGQFVVDGGHLGGHVNGSGRVDDKVLDWLVPVSLPAGHQIEDELEKK